MYSGRCNFGADSINLEKQKKILILADYFYPAFKGGGIIQSLKNLYDLCGGEEKFQVITSNKDLDGTNVAEAGDLTSDVQYTSRFRIISALRKIRWSEIECIYFNGIFSPFFFLIPLVYVRLFQTKVRVIIAPRGMLQSGALEIRSTKKMAYLRLLQKLKLFNQVRWHATDQQELVDIDQFQKLADIIVAQNLPKQPWPETTEIQIGDPNLLRLVFLSLITEKKNLHLVLQALKYNEFPVIFDIYGPVKDSQYWNQCLQLISALPENVKCEYHGAVKSQLSQEIFSQYHALILPSKGENFGHAIYECLSVGRPVIIGKNTPWKDVEKDEAGWLVELDSQDVAEAISKLGKLNQNEFGIYSGNALQTAQNYFAQADFVSDYTRLFE
jgi:glycosyltransferase involved in cell wall biosynthesis